MRVVQAILLVSLALTLPRAAGAAVEVSFVHPERYADVHIDSGYGAAPREATLRRLQKHLEQLGARHLRPDQTLKIDVLDVDLAGRFEPWHRYGYNVRFMRDITWPRIVMRYRLEDGEHMVFSAEEVVTDLNYQTRAAGRLSSDPLRYEKDMLDDWFRARFVKLTPPSG